MPVVQIHLHGCPETEATVPCKHMTLVKTRGSTTPGFHFITVPKYRRSLHNSLVGHLDCDIFAIALTRMLQNHDRQAFGNAKTAENNNSSRFGKFIQLIYLESGVLRGAFVEKFLLEKNRLVSRAKNERNFHVFYCLLMGTSKDEREEFHLLKPQDYVYLNQGEFNLNEEDDPKQEYKRLQQAMEMVGFLTATKKRILSVVSAVLLLGNVTYNQSKDTDVLEAGPAEVLSSLSQLLMVKQEQLVTTLTKKKVVTATSTVVSSYTLQEAMSARDSMAKSLYSALFDWIILHINHAMINRRDMEESVSCLSIGVLDMFGFENLQRNSFEQLCINYASEKQQFYINQNIFKFEQEVYVSEGITWENLNFTDNSDCIQLISDTSIGLLHLLNKESKFPWASDETLLDKFKQHQLSNPHFGYSPYMQGTFTIEHYAGKVKYHIKDFKKKNTEHMRPEVISLLRSSKHSFLLHLVASNPEALFRWSILRATIRIVSVFKKLLKQRTERTTPKQTPRTPISALKRRSSYLEKLSGYTLDFSFDCSDEQSLDMFEDIFVNYEEKKKNRGSRQKQIIPKNLVNLSSLHHIVGLMKHDRTSKSVFHPNRRADPPTVGAQFQTSFGKLIETIEKAEPFFIFCLRSNAEKKQLHFDDKLVLKQIKYTGILQMIHMQKSSYKAKYTFKEFVEKFGILLPKGMTGSPQEITELFEKMGLEKSTYQIGRTKVFLKEKERQLLQSTLNKEVMQRIVTLQRWFRAYLIRMHFLQKKDATMIIQRSWREFFEKQNRAATVIQTAWHISQSLDLGDHKNVLCSSQHGASSMKHSLKRQQNLDGVIKIQSPDPANNQGAKEDERKQIGDNKASVSQLIRPFSVPLDTKAGSRDPSMGNDRTRERSSEDDLTDTSSPEVHRRRDRRDDMFRKAVSVDELSSSSGCESSPSPKMERACLRRPKKHKRRLAYARSGLVHNFGGSKENEYWNFPLPPISPNVPTLTGSASVMDLWPLNSQVKMVSELDCSRHSLPARSGCEDTDLQGTKQSLTTPEKIGFFGKLLGRRAHKSSNAESTVDKSVTLPRFSTQSYQMASSNESRVQRKVPQISRATRTLEADASLDREITDPNELRNLDEFLGNQVNELQSRVKELSLTEGIFLSATMEFRETIKSMYSLQEPKVCYKSLMNGYRNKVSALAGRGKRSEVSLVVNLFQSVLDGFIRAEKKREESEPAKTTRTGKKRKTNDKCIDNPLDHLFSTYQVNIMQSCDLCNSFIWGMEKACMCSACKFVCHKKCLDKIITDCSRRRSVLDDSVPGSLHFGVQVCALTSKTNPVPKVLELLLMHVELNGLYTEGIYRKSGAACRVKELHQILQTDPENVCLDNYPIHTITGLVKRWLRELPEPLITFSLYNDFLHAAELPENQERIRAVYQKVEELPPANYNTLERLIFHFVKVAKEEKHNKMSPTSLAIVFAPCILRSADTSDPLLCMKDVPRSTLCLEILINEQLRRYNEKMQDIHELEYAEAQAVHKLKLRRQNTVQPAAEQNVPHPLQVDESDSIIIKRIKSIKKEKLDLVIRLPELEQEHSDSASSVSSDSLDQLGSVDSEGRVTKLSRAPRPKSPAKPADMVVRSRTAQDSPSPDDKQQQQLTSKTFNGSFDDLDIPYIDDVED
ncbi:unconventional myosin-IXb [Gambusia affinis]|uniref:unconventional myosin-IXb n=1 Tax=Gambusia affinis TaxID=33528 RepID=UPI001CDCB853|nr:unconventional myosin-IXb [Gambusia affinis]